MLFAVIFKDKPGLGAVRAAHLQVHIEWLEAHKDVILVGGSLRDELAQTPKGGLWIAEASSAEQIRQLIQSDPFFTAGLRLSYEVLHWSKANAQRPVRI